VRSLLADSRLVQASPFAHHKTRPRRPHGADLRATTRQALLVFGVVPAVIAALALIAHPHPDFGSGVWFGVLISGLGIKIAWARSIAYESRHLHESDAFWLAREAVIRPRMFWVCSILTIVGAVVLVVAVLSDRPILAGAVIAPTFTALSLVLLLWGKVP
jgi:hypothetical protein